MGIGGQRSVIIYQFPDKLAVPANLVDKKIVTPGDFKYVLLNIHENVIDTLIFFIENESR